MTPKLSDLKDKLLHSEFLEAQNFYNAAKSAGYSPAMITALTYKHGLTSVKANWQENVHKAYAAQAAAEKRVNELETALTAASEHISELETIMGANAQILALADLINNPVPNRTMEEIEAEIDNMSEQPTPGEKQEDENHE